MKRIAILGLLVAAIVFAGSSSTFAQGAYCGGYSGCGVNFPYGLYGSRVNDVPYFSMFPPVYYSIPIPRTYGWSPFAYPPGTMTPEIEPASPQDMVNPYVPQSKDSMPAKPTSVRTASYHPPTPQVLLNPFVKAEGIVSTASIKVVER